MPIPRRLASLCLAIAVMGAIASPAAADTDAHKLKKAKAQAAGLDAKAKQQQAQIVGARTRSAQLDAQANAALEGLQRASHAATVAAQAQARAEEVLEAAAATTAAARSVLNSLAANAYRSQSSGGTLARDAGAGQQRRPRHADGGDEPPRPGRQDPERGARRAQARRSRRRSAPRRAPRRRVLLPAQAENGAREAKQQADALVAQQTAAVASLDQLLAATKQAAQAAHAARHVPRARDRRGPRPSRGHPPRAGARRRAMPAAGCNGSSVAGYPNGQLPISALCALWGAPGEMLQAAAAASFNRMSQAFNAAFGEPLCVRRRTAPIQRQVELYATMPAGYAAVPGTSQPRLGARHRPVRRHPGRQLPRAPVAARPRRGVRLVPPGLGDARWWRAARAVALGVRRLGLRPIAFSPSVRLMPRWSGWAPASCSV